jgi:phosphoglycolate phosphatase
MFSTLAGGGACPTWLASVRACLIDLDGTLVDTLGDFTEAVNRTLAELSLPPQTPEQVESGVGKGSEHLVRTVLNQAGRSMPGHEPDLGTPEALAVYQRHYGEVNGQFSAVYPGVADGLRGLQARGLPLVCLTNKPVAFARELLAQKGLAGFFVQVYGGDSFAEKKPSPVPLLGACAALGLPPGQVLMVGDSLNDAQAARAAGCPVVLVTYGYHHGKVPTLADADAVVGSLAELA